jgi:hypothetical protein
VRRCLIETWLTSQNFRSEDFEAFWRLIGPDTDPFLDVTERFWLNRGRGTHEDEVLIKAFANAYKWRQVAERLHERAVMWMGQYWLDPDAGRFLNYDPNTVKAQAKRQATAERRREWDAIEPRLDPSPPLRCVQATRAGSRIGPSACCPSCRGCPSLPP